MRKNLFRNIWHFANQLAVLRREIDIQNDRLGTQVKIWVGGDGKNVTIPEAVRHADGWSGFGPPTEFANKAKHVAENNLEISVLLTPNDLANDLQAYVDAGADQVIRSLRPSEENTFDLAPIAQMLSERAQLIGSL